MYAIVKNSSNRFVYIQGYCLLTRRRQRTWPLLKTVLYLLPKRWAWTFLWKTSNLKHFVHYIMDMIVSQLCQLDMAKVWFSSVFHGCFSANEVYIQCKRGLQYPLITLVVSPLTSLMQDQVMTLCEKGIKACFLNCEGMWYWLTFVQCINIYSAKKHCTTERVLICISFLCNTKLKPANPL